MSNAEDSTFTPTVTHWGNFRIETRDGKICGVHPYASDPEPSPIGENLRAALDPAVRIAQPMVRQSYLGNPLDSAPHLRGIDRYVPVSWDCALELAADALRRVRAEHGNEAIFGGSYGWASAGRFHHAQSQIHRFLKLFGGYTSSVNTYSLAAGEVIVPHVLGIRTFDLVSEAPTADDIAANCKTMMLFGGAALKNSQVNQGGLSSHSAAQQLALMKAAGVDFINVSPIRDDTADFLDADWVAVKPSSDVALMLGMAHTLYVERRHDQAFLDRYCTGFDRFLPYLLGTSDGFQKDAVWASTLCGIDAERIRNLARKLSSGRSVLGVSWSLQRQEHGEQPYWMIAVLAAMLGNIGLPGGGVAYGYGCLHNSGFGGRRRGPFRLGSFPQGKNAVKRFIPVARITDMLENPGGSVAYNGQTLVYPDIKLIYWAGGNPFHHHQDLNRMRAAWRKPDVVIVNEPFWTATAYHADIVFPATTALERSDIGGSSGDHDISPMRPAAAPFGDARSDHEIFKGIAQRLDLEPAFSEGRTEMEWIEQIYATTRSRAEEKGVVLPPFDEFWRGEQIDYSAQLKDESFLLERFRNDPEANPLATPSGKIEIFSDVLAGFDQADCPGHPVWLDKDEWLGSARAARFPLHLISNQPRKKLHSQLDHGPASRTTKIRDRETVRINRLDAAARGICEGDIVRIFNDRGACLAAAAISENVRENVIELPTGAWYWAARTGDDKPLEVHGNPNVLTKDVGSSSLAQGPTAHSCLVEVERFDAALPANLAFDPIPSLVTEVLPS
jgi:biotin/methionine sulfoxide reductase